MQASYGEKCVRDASKLKVLYKTVLPREGCKISPVHLCGRPWGAKPNPQNRCTSNLRQARKNCVGTRYKQAWERKETRGELRKPILGRKSTEICGKPAENLQETCRKPREDLEARKAAKLKPKGNPPKTLGRKRAKETCTRLRQTCSKAVETCRTRFLGNPTSRERPARNHRANAKSCVRLDSESRALTVTPRTSCHCLEIVPLALCRLPNTFPCFAARRSAELRTQRCHRCDRCDRRTVLFVVDAQLSNYDSRSASAYH